MVVVSTAPIFIGSSAVSPLALGNDVYTKLDLASAAEDEAFESVSTATVNAVAP